MQDISMVIDVDNQLLLVSMFPVSEPVEKYEGKLQSTGEAKYVDDIPKGEPVDCVDDILESK